MSADPEEPERPDPTPEDAAAPEPRTPEETPIEATADEPAEAIAEPVFEAEAEEEASEDEAVFGELEPEPEPETFVEEAPDDLRAFMQSPPVAPPSYRGDVRATQPPPASRDEALFGEAEIPMPAPTRRIDRQRARDARVNLDLDLGRIKRRKRYGLVITTISVLFIAFVLAPVTWVGAYLFFDPPATLLMVQRAAEGQSISHYPVPINRISPHVVRAVIAAEDANFCTHEGFDVEAIQDAMESNRRGGRTRGASTISQQVAKNLFLWPDRSWLRKGLETYFTALVEFMWPKRRIMEAYLNAAEWGDGNFGIEAAARARFGVAAADLTPLQAARLAAVLPSPNSWSADSPGPYVRRRAATIVQRARVVRNERLASCAVILDRPAAQ